ncbi:MAG: phasin family protein [Limnohabitans sp.]|jgi:hypothetical protein|nr:hypothetical protein [Betaproteobacteria bacterium]
MQDQLKQFKPQIEASVEAAYEVAHLALSQVERAAELSLAQSKQNAAFAKSQLQAVTDLKDPAAVFQFVQNQLEASAKYAAGVATAAFELSQEFQTELAELAENQFEAKHAEVNQLIAETLKKAPQGSEAAVAAVKQAVEAGNKAVAQARTAAKKSAELAKQGLEQLKANAPKTAKPARRRA